MAYLRRLPIAVSVLLLGCARARPAAFSDQNPFAAASPLFDQAPPFDRIHDADYQPAIDEGMRRQLAEIAAIAGDTAAPTFDNTIVAMERSGVLLRRAPRSSSRSPRRTRTTRSSRCRRWRRRGSPRTATPSTSTTRCSAASGASTTGARSSAWTRCSSSWSERYYRDFVRAGALLNDADKAKLRALNKEEATLSTEFQKRLLAATKAGALVVTDSTELAGFSPAELAAAAQAAQRPQARPAVGGAAAEHDAAAGAGGAGRPGDARAAVRGVHFARRARRQRRHARTSSRAWPSCAPSAPGCSASPRSPPTCSTTRWPRRPTRPSSC